MWTLDRVIADTRARDAVRPRYCWEKSACGKLETTTGLFKSVGDHFRQKKGPAASWIAATGLVKSWDGNFYRKKALAASRLAAKGLVKSWVAIFILKKRLRPDC